MELKVTVQRINPHEILSFENAKVQQQHVFQASTSPKIDAFSPSSKEEVEKQHIIHLPVATPLFTDNITSQEEGGPEVSEIAKPTVRLGHRYSTTVRRKAPNDNSDSWTDNSQYEQALTKTGHVPIVYAENTQLNMKLMNTSFSTSSTRPCTVSRLIRNRQNQTERQSVLDDNSSLWLGTYSCDGGPSMLKASIVSLQPDDHNQQELEIDGEKLDPIDRKLSETMFDDVHHTLHSNSTHEGRQSKTSKSGKRGKQQRDTTQKKSFRMKKAQRKKCYELTRKKPKGASFQQQNAAQSKKTQTKLQPFVARKVLSPASLKTDMKSTCTNKLSPRIKPKEPLQDTWPIHCYRFDRASISRKKRPATTKGRSTGNEKLIKPPVVLINLETGRPTSLKPKNEIVPPWYTNTPKREPGLISGIANYYLTYAESKKLVSSVGQWNWAQGGNQQFRKDYELAKRVIDQIEDPVSLKTMGSSHNIKTQRTSCNPGSVEHLVNRHTRRALEQLDCISALRNEVEKVRGMVLNVAENIGV